MDFCLGDGSRYDFEKYRMTMVQCNEIPIFDIDETLTIVKKSSRILGNGLFITKDTGIHQPLCIYPNHGMCVHRSSFVTCDFKMTIEQLGDNCYSQWLNSYSRDEYFKKEPRLKCNKDDPTISIIGNPSNLKPGSCGHMINDYFTTDIGIGEYISKSSENCNCIPIHVGMGLVIIYSLREIKENEELFMTYGPNYWEEKLNYKWEYNHSEAAILYKIGTIQVSQVNEIFKTISPKIKVFEEMYVSIYANLHKYLHKEDFCFQKMTYEIRDGTKIIIIGLKKSPIFNGVKGVVLKTIKDRYRIKLDKPINGKTFINVKYENLEII